MKKKRSTGVTIWAVLFILSGLAALPSIIGVVAYQQPEAFTAETYKSNPIYSKVPPEELEKIFENPEFKKMMEIQNNLLESGLFDYENIWPISIINFMGGLFCVGLGIGFLKLEELARKGVLYYCFVFIPIQFTVFGINSTRFMTVSAEIAGMQGPPSTIILATQGLFLLAGVLLLAFFFTRPKVKEQFQEDELVSPDATTL